MQIALTEPGKKGRISNNFLVGRLRTNKQILILLTRRETTIVLKLIYYHFYPKYQLGGGGGKASFSQTLAHKIKPLVEGKMVLD